MPPHKGPQSLTDSERFSSDGSNDSCRPRFAPSSSRRRVGVADANTSSLNNKPARKSTSFHNGDKGRALTTAGALHSKIKSFDDRQRRTPRRYIQEDDGENLQHQPVAVATPRRKYVQESTETNNSNPPLNSRQKECRQSSQLRSSKTNLSNIARPKESVLHVATEEKVTTDIANLVAENKALEAERATIEKYKRMYEAILQDPSNAFLFDGSSSVVDPTSNDSPESKGKDTFDAALNVEELIEGLKLKDLLHDSATAVGGNSSESVSILSEIRQSDATGDVAAAATLEKYRPKSKRADGSGGGSRDERRSKPSVRKSEKMMNKRREENKSSRSKSQFEGGDRKMRSGSNGALSSSIKSKSSDLDSSDSSRRIDTSGRSNDQNFHRRPRSGSKSLSSSMKSDRSCELDRRRPRSNSKGGLSSSLRSQGSKSDLDLSGDQRICEPISSRRPRSNSKNAAIDNGDINNDTDNESSQHRRKSTRRQIQDPDLNSSQTSNPRSRHQHEERQDRDNISVTSNTSSGSRVGRFFSRFSFSSNADRSVADESDYETMTDVEDDVVPDLNVNFEKKKKGLLFKTMKRFGKKVSKAFNSGPGFKKYKVGEVARYNIGKIRDSLESFDPQDPTVEVVIVAVHIDAVLEIPYYTIQLPDGSRKQTNMENLIPLEEYNNGARPYSRIKERRSSSRRRSSRQDEADDDDRSVSSSRSNKSTRSTQSNRSTRSSSSRHSSKRDDGSVKSSSSRQKSSSKSGSRKDRDYRPKVDAMRGGGMAVPDKGAQLKAVDRNSKSKEKNDDEEPVIIKLTSRNSVGSSFALDAAVAAAVGVRRASASLHSSSRSCCGTSVSSTICNKSFASLQIEKRSQHSEQPTLVELTPSKEAKPPSVVELSPSKSKPPSIVELSSATKSRPPSTIDLVPKKKHSTKPASIAVPQGMIRHANTMDDTAARQTRTVSEQQKRSRSAGPPREKLHPKGTCSKCDGCHKAVDCPIYLKGREKHKDSWRYYYGENNEKKQMGEDGGDKRVKANRIKQPADGSCLFHSLVYCFNSMRDRRMSSSTSISSSSSTVTSCVPPPLTHKHLRKKIANYISANPNLLIADDPLKEWVLWDSGQSVKEYASAMAISGWGGGIEIAACSQLYKVNIHVYEADPKSNEFVRISCFNSDSKTKKTLHILYHGRNHYDALQLK